MDIQCEACLSILCHMVTWRIGASANTELTTDHLLALTRGVFISALLASDWLIVILAWL